MVFDQAHGADGATRMWGVLHDARDRGFVGRAAEIASIAASFSGSSGVRVHLVHGPGGIGKTTLLDAVARDVARRHGRSVYIDARDLPCSMSAVTAIVARKTAAAGPIEADAPDALLIDGYELLDPLDRWFREEFLPSRTAASVTVLASRSAPRPGWRLDPGWRQLARAHELPTLGAAETHEFLERLGVPDDRRGSVERLGRGHPLALAMLAETARSGRVLHQLDEAPDVVSALCRLIIDDVPDAAHRAGLATCAHATRMTEDLLAHTVGPGAAEVWAWLESRPYVRRGAIGLFIHDVVRELFEAEFAHRAPQAYAQLHNTVKDYFVGRLMDPAEVHPDRAAAEMLLLHRKGPLADESQTLREGGILSVAHARPEDYASILSLIENGEGPESARLARRWFAAQPDGLYRACADSGVEAFGMQAYLPSGGDLDIDDPVAAAVLAAVERHGPVRPGERINVNRFSGASGAYQRDPMLLLVNGVSCILEWSRRPAAWTFLVTVDPAHYAPYFEYLGLTPMLALDYFGTPLVAYGWDRRRLPVPSLFEMMSRRELSGESGPPPADMLRPAPLSRREFDAAVRGALLDLDRPDRLARSPLLGTALIQIGAAEPATALHEALLAAIAALERERRGAEHRRVLDRTFLRGAPSQEAAAQLLDLPFSTYRRHLAQAQQRLVEVLWAVEIGERPPLGPR